MLLRDKGTHLRFAIGTLPNLQASNLELESRDQPVRRVLADRYGNRDRHAALTGGAIRGAHQRIDRVDNQFSIAKTVHSMADFAGSKAHN